MRYPNFGKVKTIVLPVPTQDLTFDEYQRAFGIDLREFIFLESGLIYFDAHGYYIMINTITDKLETYLQGFNNAILPVVRVRQNSYNEGVDNGVLILGVYSDSEENLTGIGLIIDKDDDFDINNIKVVGQGF